MSHIFAYFEVSNVFRWNIKFKKIIFPFPPPFSKSKILLCLFLQKNRMFKFVVFFCARCVFDKLNFFSKESFFFLDHATCNLSSLPDFSTFELGTCFECSRGNFFCLFECRRHALHGMNKHVRFWRPCSVICSCSHCGHSKPL